MKKTLCFLMLVSLVILQACSASTARFSNLKVASQINAETLLPETETEAFSTTSPIIYVTGTIKNATLDMVITVKWIYLETDPETLITEFDLDVDEISMDFAFNLTRPNNGWPVGAYEAHIYLDGEYKTKVTFSVT